METGCKRMREITLGSRPIEVLRVNIGKETYSLPLAGSLSVKEAAGMDSQEKVIAFFQKHIPKDVLEQLTVDDLTALSQAWSEESEKAGSKLGESAALRNS